MSRKLMFPRLSRIIPFWQTDGYTERGTGGGGGKAESVTEVAQTSLGLVAREYDSVARW